MAHRWVCFDEANDGGTCSEASNMTACCEEKAEVCLEESETGSTCNSATASK